MKIQKPPKFALLTMVAALLLGAAPSAASGKLEVLAGAFSFSGKNARNSTSSSISGLGSYRFAYKHPILSQFELDFGYSLIATDTIGGDLAFGLDIGVNYFPLSMNGQLRAEDGGSVVVISQRWRPLVGISFNQRNFQSTSSQYAGGGLKIGTEYQWRENLSFTAIARYITMGGPNQSSANQIDMLGGIVVQF